MKPIDLNKKFDKGANFGDFVSGDIRKLRELQNKDCIIAYLETELGRVILIKGKKKYYSWAIYKGLVTRGRGNNIFRLGKTRAGTSDDVKEFFKMCKGNYIVVDKEEFKKLKRKVAVDNL